MITANSASAITSSRTGSIASRGAGATRGDDVGFAVGVWVCKVLGRSVTAIIVPSGNGRFARIETFVLHGVTASPIQGVLVRDLENIPVGWVLNFFGSLFFHDDIYILLDENGMHLQVKDGKYLGISVEIGNDS